MMVEENELFGFCSEEKVLLESRTNIIVMFTTSFIRGHDLLFNKVT